jgi:quinol monooxygenase YgiN
MMGLAEPSRLEPASAPMEGVVCAILRAEARRGFDDEFAALMNDLAHLVRTEEPGCESYVVTRAMGSLAHFVMHARFSNWRAFEAHADTPHLTRLMPRLNALLAAPIAMEIFLEV